MDKQLKRGMLDICVLAVLIGGDSYGYKIIQDLNAVLAISESTLYPILRRLEESGAVRVYSVEHNGRLRKYYAITDTGKQKITTFLDEWKSMMDIYAFIKGAVNGNE